MLACRDDSAGGSTLSLSAGTFSVISSPQRMQRNRVVGLTRSRSTRPRLPHLRQSTARLFGGTNTAFALRGTALYVFLLIPCPSVVPTGARERAEHGFYCLISPGAPVATARAWRSIPGIDKGGDYRGQKKCPGDACHIPGRRSVFRAGRPHGNCEDGTRSCLSAQSLPRQKIGHDMPIPGEPGVHQQEARETSDRTGHPISPRSCATSAWGTERPAGH